MKKILFFTIMLFLALSVFPQEPNPDTASLKISVPVRVFSGNTFVNDLTIDDFQLFENQKPQEIKALFLVKNNEIKRKEVMEDYKPELGRNYYFLFQITSYNPRMAEGLDYFFQNIYKKGDSLTIMTPANHYKLSRKALERKSGESLSQELQRVIRKDATMGASYYRTLTSDLKRIVRSISIAGSFGSRRATTEDASAVLSTTNDEGGQLSTLLSSYRSTLGKLDELRLVDENEFIKFAFELDKIKGPKIVMLFYEKEFRPEISQRVLSEMISNYQDKPNIIGDIQDLFQFYQRQTNLDVNKLQAIFADASVLFNFIFLNKQAEQISGVTMRDQSEDVFSTFIKVAKATGGLVSSPQNPAFAFRNALNFADSYYLLYYSPEADKKEGEFNSIRVSLKNENYKVMHRAGYFTK